MNDNNIRKKTIKIFLVFLFSVILYSFFVTGYYSIDSEKIYDLGYEKYATEYSLCDGRVFMYIILMIANLLKVNLEVLYIILLLISLFISSCSVIFINDFVDEIRNEKSKFLKVLIFMLSYSYIFNFMSINNMEFIECIIMSISILLFIIASKKIVIQNKILLGSLLCLLGILFYQGTINVFITTAIMFLALKEKDKKEKKYYIKNLLIIGGVALSVMIFDVLIVNLLSYFVQESQHNRMSFNIITNISKMITNISILVFDSLYLFPKNMHAIMIIIITVIMYVYSIKNEKANEFFNLIFLILVAYFSSLIVGLVVNSSIIMFSNGRMFFSVGAIVPMILLYIYAKTDIFYNKNSVLVKIIVIVYFIINVFNIIYVTGIFKLDNIKERNLSFRIKEELQKNNINKIAIDYSLGKEKRGIEKNKIILANYTTKTYKVYIKEEIARAYFEKEIKEKYFSDGKEKMCVINDVLYIMLETDNYN